MTRLFLVDDHAVLRAGLRLMLHGQPNLAVVGEAGSGEGLLAQLAQTEADVVLLDLGLPDLPGLEVVHRLQEQHPATRVLVLSSTADLTQVESLFEAGARGYALKSVGIAELVHAIRVVAANRRFLCTELGMTALQGVRDQPRAGQAGAAVPPPVRSAPRAPSGRESEVLQLVANGWTNAAIADRLNTSQRTVETHRQNLITKLQVKNTAALVLLAISQGWVR
jgi:DNA-binding NarL/FixJ family response regulator